MTVKVELSSSFFPSVLRGEGVVCLDHIFGRGGIAKLNLGHNDVACDIWIDKLK